MASAHPNLQSRSQLARLCSMQVLSQSRSHLLMLPVLQGSMPSTVPRCVMTPPLSSRKVWRLPPLSGLSSIMVYLPVR